jgi:hypothetical protein
VLLGNRAVSISSQGALGSQAPADEVRVESNNMLTYNMRWSLGLMSSLCSPVNVLEVRICRHTEPYAVALSIITRQDLLCLLRMIASHSMGSSPALDRFNTALFGHVRSLSFWNGSTALSCLSESHPIGLTRTSSVSVGNSHPQVSKIKDTNQRGFNPNNQPGQVGLCSLSRGRFREDCHNRGMLFRTLQV